GRELVPHQKNLVDFVFNQPQNHLKITYIMCDVGKFCGVESVCLFVWWNLQRATNLITEIWHRHCHWNSWLYTGFD
ncbi:hypothetical protein S245_048478, partial [Arachis hypogaea]